LVLICFIVSAFSKLVVHEWGTYTSMQGPNGIPMPGLHHGEEKLPEFVHSRANEQKRGINPPPLPTAATKAGCYFCEVMDWTPTPNSELEVTQKLETPVIYFYKHSNSYSNITATVQFPEGIITETYPRPTLNLPPIGQVQKTGNGLAQWHVKTAPLGTSLEVPYVASDNIWAPSRKVQANFVENFNGEKERHIFYRGLGRFVGPVSVQSTMDSLVVENLHEEIIPAVWVLSCDGVKGVVRELGQLDGKLTVQTELSLLSSSSAMDMDQYIARASDLIAAELVKAGLFPLEARAMVDTWKNSYFRSAGVRVLYIAPKSYPDTLLPMKINPTPRSISRVLVGRVEVLLKSDEKYLSEAAHHLIINNNISIKTNSNKNVAEYVSHVKSLGRFAEAKLRYVLSLPSASALLTEEKSKLVEKWILDNLTYATEN